MQSTEDRLSQAESNFLRAIMMWGASAYPVQKMGNRWFWTEFWGVKGAPTSYKTKREAVGAVERYVDILIDRKAGRI